MKRVFATDNFHRTGKTIFEAVMLQEGTIKRNMVGITRYVFQDKSGFYH